MAIGIDTDGTKIAVDIISEKGELFKRSEVKSDPSDRKKMFVKVAVTLEQVLEDATYLLAGKLDCEKGIATPEEVFYMASTAPSKSIGIDGECGMIANGYDADFIYLTPELELTATYSDGDWRFQTENLIGEEGVQ
ncbi:amidohydrolase family protein [Bacillus sp. SRB1LM]|uniref:amidohydrolase family protein n=1 Tax=Bacillus sp. SRB1LM TaxID=2608688 RepID=UPI001E603F84|nr:amidohydrolase family protein [Bacillus sp. SRB1LM]